MISLTVNFDKAKQAAVEAALSGVKNGAPKAMSRAINRAVDFGKTRASKLIREEYTINAGAVRRATGTTKASAGRLAGVIRFTSRTKQLRNFQHRKNKKGIYVAVKRAGGRKHIPRAFINNLHSSGGAILRRLGKPRFPIEVLHGPSVPQMAGNVNVAPKIRKDVEDKLNERLVHELSVLMRGIVK